MLRSELSTATVRSESAGIDPPYLGQRALSATLTPVQRLVLVHLACGKTVPEIAASTHRSRKTVDGYKTQLMRKLGVHNRVALTCLAIRDGLVRIDPDGRPLPTDIADSGPLCLYRADDSRYRNPQRR